MSDIRVFKRDAHGQPILHYDGQVVERGTNYVCLRAVFNYADSVAVGHGVTFRRGDIFTEWFYADRYYNAFRVQDGDSGDLRCWYCDIARPAEIAVDSVASDDLALDVLVLPDRTVHLLDEDEFAALDITEAERQTARAAVRDIRAAVTARTPPFD